jgi:ATP-dependent Lon protease
MLAHIYSTSPAPRKDDSIIVGCVPLASPLLSRDGLRLLTHNDEKDTARESAKPAKPAAPAQATKDDLFGFGTLARINSLHNRLGGELALIVEGISRFKISEITKERPYFEGKVDYHPNAGMIPVGR